MGCITSLAATEPRALALSAGGAGGAAHTAHTATLPILPTLPTLPITSSLHHDKEVQVQKN